jgi:thioredoxin-like negative regulator of GroEL
MLLLNHQHYQQNLESLNSDEQLWEAQLLGELNTLAIIQALSQIGAQQPAGIHQHQELPPSSTMQPYEKALNQVFKRETKERAQLIIEFAHEQRWREVQQQLTAIQFSAEKFASDSLNQQIEALSNATYQQDNAALERAIAQLSG